MSCSIHKARSQQEAPRQMSLYYSQLWRKLTTDVFVLFTTVDPSKKLMKRFLCTLEIRNVLAISDGGMFTIVTLSRIIAWNVGLLTVSCSSLFSYKISDITQNIWKSHTFDPGKTKDTIMRFFSLNLQVWIGQHPKIFNVALTCSSKV